MKPIIQYQIEVAICMAAFTLLYLIFWRKETNFLLKRIILLVIPLFSIIIPLINVNIDFGPKPESNTIQYITYIPNQLEMVYAPIVAKAETLSGWEIAFWVMCMGIGIMVVRLLISYLKIIQIYYRSEADISGEFRIIDDPIQSFSFFNMIVINKSQAQSGAHDYILAHENAHKRQGHSWDILWLEAIKMLHWFNPIIWLLTQESRKNLEYLADQEVAATTGNLKNYQFAIVEHATQTSYQLLKTQFSKNNLKNRIIMMNQPNNYRFASWKLLTIIPLLAILLMSFSLKIENLDIKKELVEVLPEFKSINKPESTILSDESDEKIYEISEVGPMPDGKRMKYFYENLYEHIEKTTKYKKDEIQGRAIIHFIVMKDGSLEDLRIIEGIKPEIDQEILRFVNKGPSWTPGLEQGEPVNVRRVLTIPFGKETNPVSSSRRLMGKLINEQDFSAITDAKIAIRGTDIETTTDEAGIFWLDLDPSHKELIISSRQFSTRTYTIPYKQKVFRQLIRVDKPNKDEIPTDSINEIFTIVEDQPYPSTGDWTSYFEKINSDLQYPKEAREKGVEGKVFVQFIVKKDGSLDDIKVVKGISQECDEEAVRVVREGPSWIPGRQRGQAVNVRMIVPITFIGENKITGTVRSEDRKPVAGANVIIKGTPTGTVTDNNGKFILQIESDQSEIVIASVGYRSVIEKIIPGSNYDIFLERDPNTPLPQSKSISENEGLLIKANGKNILDPNEKPLYIINGVEMEDFDERTLNPHDIESIQILKDKKAAIEKYGEKAKNGVVIIKTNKSDDQGTIERKKQMGRKLLGKVLNTKGEPIENAFVNIKGSSHVNTNEFGQFELYHAKTQFPRIQAFKEGYLWTEMEITSYQDQVIILPDFPIKKIKNVIDENGPQSIKNNSGLKIQQYDIVISGEKVFAREPEFSGNFEKFGQELGIQSILDSAAVRLFGENASGGINLRIMR